MDRQVLKEIINKYNVLYVEDDLSVAKMSQELFGEIFKQVDTAKNGIEALELYDDYYKSTGKYYDIVISDIKMPQMDGTELSKRIKQINNKQCILIISAHNESSILQNLINIGITYFIHKPVQFNELIKVITQIHNELQQEIDSKEQIDEVIKLNDEFEALLTGYDDLIIASRTDMDGVITYVSKGFVSISGYSEEEMIGNKHSIVRHPDMPNSMFKNMWETITKGKIWKGKVKNKKKDGDYYWAKTSVAPYFDKEGNILGYNSIREDITNQVKLTELHKKVDTLLNHANDGYLLIDKNLKVQQGYSKVCLEIFNKSDIEGCEISELIFPNNTKNKELLLKGLQKIFTSNDNAKNKLFLSLLPTQTILYDKSLKISYKIIDNTIMMIIKDITEKVNLESKLALEQKHQKMVIHIITNLNDFLDLKKDFEKFYQQFYSGDQFINLNFDKNEKTQEILRSLHTFKGLFHQLQMCYTTETIHNFEEYITELINHDKTSPSSDDTINIKQSFQKDLQIIEKTLGKEYIAELSNKTKNKNTIKKIKYQLRSLIKEPVNINFQLQKIISEIDLLSYINVDEVVSKHISLVEYLSDLTNKPIYPLEIKKEENLKVPPTFKNFFRNLVHVYKNSVDHGIEDEESRLYLDKDPIGKISCEYYYFKKNFHLIIKDDGQGVDTQKLTQKALQESLITNEEFEQMSEDDKLQLIFKDSLSTKDTANEISGRGVGMASLKQSCEELGGTIELQNFPNQGLEYHFVIPMDRLLDTYESEEYLQEFLTLLEAISNRLKSFFKQDLSIDVINARFVENCDLTNKVNTQIDLINGKETTRFIFSYTRRIVQKYAEVYFADIFEDDLDETIDEYSKEMINTLVGLAIQDFPTKYIDGILGTPKSLTQEELQANKTKGTEKKFTLLIQTNYGNMICQLIHEK